MDGVFEREVQTQRAVIWVPVLPDLAIPSETEKGKSWRRWAFERCHMTILEPHKPSGPTWQTLKRVVFWPTMYKDVILWLNMCAVCHQYRTVGQMAPMRSTLAALPNFRLLWSDVILNCQGPFARSAEGNCHTVIYHCTLLGVPKVEPFKRLTQAYSLQALVACVMRARRIPDIVRTDRGPEMTSALMEEFLTLCNARQFLGAAFTPRHQGPGERKHISVMQQWLILIDKVCNAFPQEWDVLAPVVEYLMDTEVGECGFSAHEMQTGYPLL